MIPEHVRDVVSSVSARHGVRPELVAGKFGSKPVYRARHEAIAILRAEGYTQGQLGRWFGIRQQSVSDLLKRAAQ